jgi:hypothetical protein
VSPSVQPLALDSQGGMFGNVLRLLPPVNVGRRMAGGSACPTSAPKWGGRFRLPTPAFGRADVDQFIGLLDRSLAVVGAVAAGGSR